MIDHCPNDFLEAPIKVTVAIDIISRTAMSTTVYCTIYSHTSHCCCFISYPYTLQITLLLLSSPVGLDILFDIIILFFYAYSILVFLNNLPIILFRRPTILFKRPIILFKKTCLLFCLVNYFQNFFFPRISIISVTR